MNPGLCITSLKKTIEKTRSGFDRPPNNYSDRPLDKVTSCCSLGWDCRNTIHAWNVSNTQLERLEDLEGLDIQRPSSTSPVNHTLSGLCPISLPSRKRHDIVSMMRSSERDVFLDEERKYSSWKGGGQLFLNLQEKHEFFYYESSVKRLKALNSDHASRPRFCGTIDAF